MAIIGFDADVPIDYMPAYSGNRKSADPCIVRLKFVPYAKVQAYSRVLQGRLKGVVDDLEAADIGRGLQREQFVASVQSIQGYTIGDKAITDPGEFYDKADAELVIEIVRAMESVHKLSAGQLKNSPPPSAGT